MRKVYIDTETCGFHGMPVLLQYAFDDGPINLYSPWSEPIHKTLSLIEEFTECGVIGFNLAFDWFHISKLYTTLRLIEDKNKEPQYIINEIAYAEKEARSGPCVKPLSAMDLMLHARKGPYQSTMDRSDIRIRKVPTALAWQLAAELEKRVKLSDIYFARKKIKNVSNWQVKDIEGNPDFKDIVLSFAASSALKVLAADALKVNAHDILKFNDVEIHKVYKPVEVGYAPFALAIGNKDDWKGAWPSCIMPHHYHWKHHATAREYASDDVKYTRGLYEYFGKPELGDDDSILACMVASVRWHGHNVNVEGMKKLRKTTIDRQYIKLSNGETFSVPTDSRKARVYVAELMDDVEKEVSDILNSTNKVILDKVSKWEQDTPEGKKPHPAAKRAKEVLDARQGQYEYNFYDKLIKAERFHASTAVIGTLSSRMGGGGSAKGIEGGGFAKGDGLNPQGVKKTKEVRREFPLAFDGYILCGGDFSAYEITLAAAVYNDANLDKQLLTCEKCGGEMKYDLDKCDFPCIKCKSTKGKKIHALFGTSVFPEYDYEGIKATEGTSDDKYTKSKSAVFTMVYGGTEYSLMERLGVEREAALLGMARFHKQFPGVKKAQQRTINAFAALQQVGGIGSRVTWKDPAEYIESMLGFRRYFTLENQICKALFDLAQKPPLSWKDIKVKVVRRDREQGAAGAVMSALYGAAFQIVAANTRAAINHEIQSPGATITKRVQRNIWNVQPPGVHKFRVIPLNVHDEIMCPTLPEYVDEVAKIVKDTVEYYRPKVPLIKMDWVKKLNSWADKS